MVSGDYSYKAMGEELAREQPLLSGETTAQQIERIHQNAVRQGTSTFQAERDKELRQVEAGAVPPAIKEYTKDELNRVKDEAFSLARELGWSKKLIDETEISQDYESYAKFVAEASDEKARRAQSREGQNTQLIDERIKTEKAKRLGIVAGAISKGIGGALKGGITVSGRSPLYNGPRMSGPTYLGNVKQDFYTTKPLAPTGSPKQIPDFGAKLRQGANLDRLLQAQQGGGLERLRNAGMPTRMPTRGPLGITLPQPTREPMPMPTLQSTAVSPNPEMVSPLIEQSLKPGESIESQYPGPVWFWVGSKQGWEQGGNVSIIRMITNSFRFAGIGQRTGQVRSKTIGKNIDRADLVASKRN